MKFGNFMILIAVCLAFLPGCARASSRVNPTIYAPLQPALASSQVPPTLPAPAETQTSPDTQASMPTPGSTLREFLADMPIEGRILTLEDVGREAIKYQWKTGANIDLESIGLPKDLGVGSSALVSFVSASPSGATTDSFCVELKSDDGIQGSFSDFLNLYFPARRDFPLLSNQEAQPSPSISQSVHPVGYMLVSDQARQNTQWTFRVNDGPYYYVYNAGKFVCGISYSPYEDESEYSTLMTLTHLGKLQYEKSLR